MMDDRNSFLKFIVLENIQEYVMKLEVTFQELRNK